MIGTLVYGHSLSSNDNGIVRFDDLASWARNFDSATIEMGEQYTVKAKESFGEGDSDMSDQVISHSFKRLVFLGFEQKRHITWRHAGLTHYGQMNIRASDTVNDILTC